MAGTQDDLGSRPTRGSQSHSGQGVARSRPGAAAQRTAAGRVFRRPLLQRPAARGSCRSPCSGRQVPALSLGRRLRAVARARMTRGANSTCDQPAMTPGSSGPTTAPTGTDRGLKHRAEGESQTGSLPASPDRRCFASTSTRFGGAARRPALPRSPRSADSDDHLPTRLGLGPRGGPDCRGLPLPASSPTLRPPSRLPVHMAERGSGADPGRRMGRP